MDDTYGADVSLLHVVYVIVLYYIFDEYKFFLMQAEQGPNGQFAIDFQYNWGTQIGDTLGAWGRDIKRLVRALKVVDNWDAAVSLVLFLLCYVHIVLVFYCCFII